jgi:hypothetical protein
MEKSGFEMSNNNPAAAIYMPAASHGRSSIIFAVRPDTAE